MIAEQLPEITQHAELPYGWRFVELHVTAEPWPGYAWVLVSPGGDVAIMGDGGPTSEPYDVDDADQVEHDIAWARRVLGKPIATWQLETVTS